MSFSLNPADFGFQGGSQRKSKSKRKKTKKSKAKKGKTKRKSNRRRQPSQNQFSQFQQSGGVDLMSLQTQGGGGSAQDLFTNFSSNISAIRSARAKSKKEKKNNGNGSAPQGSLTKFFSDRKAKKRKQKTDAFDQTLRNLQRDAITPEGKERKRKMTMNEVFKQNIRSKKKDFVSKFRPGKEIGVRKTNGSTRIIEGSRDRSIRNNPNDPDAFFIE